MVRYSPSDAEAFANRMNFEKQNGLLPVIVQEVSTKDVLMLAYMDRNALIQTLTTGYLHYYSRTRKRLWKKGEESGHVQELLTIRPDCDNDTLLAVVKQEGVTCHTGKKTCFTSGFDFLFHIIRERKASPRQGSYTNRLLSDLSYAQEKVREEAEELCTATTVEHTTWELVDLLYHAFALAVGRGVTQEAVEAEIFRRHEEKETTGKRTTFEEHHQSKKSEG